MGKGKTIVQESCALLIPVLAFVELRPAPPPKNTKPRSSLMAHREEYKQQLESLPRSPGGSTVEIQLQTAVRGNNPGVSSPADAHIRLTDFVIGESPNKIGDLRISLWYTCLCLEAFSLRACIVRLALFAVRQNSCRVGKAVLFYADFQHIASVFRIPLQGHTP
ncbi:hypothetical protein BaRGS_00038783 [Batillaria attramentaria]|uniref:Uncharacterized protein n=1 Tax=Batillaria attramentaria TaxID=370345 RepID=A0ABD0J4Y5_9CAEN